MIAAALSPSILDEAALRLVAKRKANPWLRDRRVNQIAPDGDWRTWLVMAGRGFGKTRTGAEWVCERIARHDARLIALVAPTAADARDVMVQGESGLLACAERWGLHAKYQPSRRRVAFANGAQAFTYSADEPDRLRGPQHDCFIAGTMVATPDGERPIETIGVGDFVLTRFGPRRVIAARSVVKPIGVVQFSNGAVLTGTSTHPVLTLHGWTIMSMLVQGEQVCAGEQRPTATWPATWRAGRSTSTDGFGNKPTGRFRPVITSTIETATRKTTTSPIWNSLRRNLISATTPQLPSALPILASIAAAPSFAGAGRSANPFASAASPSEPKQSGSRNASAWFAARRSQAERATTVVSVASTWVPAGTDTVYNITVDGDPEFIANGIVVHNSAWSDEIGAWRYGVDAWDMLQFGLRLGTHPRQIATTTPRPVQLVRNLVAQIADGTVVITHGSTRDNAANLAPSFLAEIERRYGGTRLGRQEIDGLLLEDVEGAFWDRAMLDANRVRQAPELRRIVVAIDPATTHGEDADYTGVAVAGIAPDGGIYVLHAEQLRLSPDGWARRAVDLYDQYRADAVIAERNQGGEMVEFTIRTVRRAMRVKTIHASRGKAVRAEPVVALYEQGRVHHVGTFADLEDQMCSFPVAVVHEDILDAVVYAVSELEPRTSNRIRGIR